MATSIIERAAWGARHRRGAPDPEPEPRVVIHHSYRPVLTPETTPEQERAAVRAVERYHVENNGWAGIGYNFLVAPSGRVYEGRGWRYRGAHAGPVNGESIGVCLLIDGSVTPANEATIRAVRELIRAGLEAGEIASDYTVSGHRDHMPRTCPGDKVYAQLPEFRHDAGGAGPDDVLPHPGKAATDEGDLLEPISHPSPEHLRRAASALGVDAEAIVAAAPALEAVLGAVAAGSHGERPALAEELRVALRSFRESHDR